MFREGVETSIRVLYVGRPDDTTSRVAESLAHAGFPVARLAVVETGDLSAVLGDGAWDVVFVPVDQGPIRIREAATCVARTNPGTPVIAVGAERTGPLLVASLEAGARDLVVPGEPDHLGLVVERELSRRATARDGGLRAGEREVRRGAGYGSELDALVLYGRFVQATDGFARRLGFADSTEVIGLAPADVIARADAARVSESIESLAGGGGALALEARPVRGAGRQKPLALEFVPLTADDSRHFRMSIRHLDSAAETGQTGRRPSLVRRLSELSLRDPLSGLHHRPRLLSVLERALARRASAEPRAYLLLIEVEQLGAIRRACGISASDLLIREFAAMLRSVVPAAWLHARLADATFALVLRGGGLERAREVAERVRRAAKERIWDAGAHSIATACSIGVVALDGSLPGPDEALARADLLCRAALTAGGDRVNVDESAVGLLPDDPTLVGALRDAVREERMSVVFQPIVGLRAEGPEHYDAYLRAHDRAGSVLPAGDVFRVADAEGLAVDLDKWVMARVVAVLGEDWAGRRKPLVFIRVSEASVHEPSVLVHLRKALWTHRVPGERLVLEISDPAVAHSMRAARDFSAGARALGCSTALAGFDGASHSRNLIRWLDPRYVRFPPALTEGLGDDPRGLGAVRSVQGAARELGLFTIATRVQNASSLTVLWECGVDYVQGNYLHEPGPALGAPAGA